MRVILHETMSGEFVTEFEFSEVSWTTGVCRPDEVTATLPGYIGRRWYEFMVPRKFSVSVMDDDGRTLAAGVVSIPEGDTDDDGIKVVRFPTRGIESVFERQPILPYPFHPLVDTAGYPIPARDTRIAGVQYGTMMKRLYQQSMTHPGGTLPVVFEVDRPGTRERAWAAVDGKSVQEAVEDISALLGGVEWDWVPNVDENDRLTWTLVTGTDTDPEITSAFWHTWQSGGEEPDIDGLTVKVSPEFMASATVFTGGKDDDRVMVSYASSPTLIDAGLPWSMVWDTSHSSVSVQATLDGWAQKALEEGQAPAQYWSFDVRADRADGLRHGDWCTIEVADHWLIPDGSYSRRVVEVSGSADPEYLGVVVAGELAW